MKTVYFVDPYRKETADVFYKMFLERLRKDGIISERVYQQITIVAVDE